MMNRDIDDRRRNNEEIEDWQDRSRRSEYVGREEERYGRGMDQGHGMGHGRGMGMMAEGRFGRGMGMNEGRFGRGMDFDHDYARGMDSRRGMGMGMGMDEGHFTHGMEAGQPGRGYGRVMMDMGRYGEDMRDMGRYGEGMRDMGRYGEGMMDMGRYGEGMMDMGRYGRGGMIMHEGMRGMYGSPYSARNFDPIRGYGHMGEERFGMGGPGSMGLQGGFGGSGLRERMGKGPKGYHRSDERIREDICDCLMAHPWMDSSDVDIQVKDGEVTLTGTVKDRISKREMEDVVESILGVQEVQNHLRLIRSEQQSMRMGTSGMSAKSSSDKTGRV